jgi:hypothetical protein
VHSTGWFPSRVRKRRQRVIRAIKVGRAVDQDELFMGHNLCAYRLSSFSGSSSFLSSSSSSPGAPSCAASMVCIWLGSPGRKSGPFWPHAESAKMQKKAENRQSSFIFIEYTVSAYWNDRSNGIPERARECVFFR